MKRSKLKLKIVILGVVLILSMACIAALGYMILKSHRQANRMKQAVVSLRENRLDEAQRYLFEIIRRDNTNETAFRMLAEISEKRNDYMEAATFWIQVSRLNPLITEPRSRAIQLMAAARLYQELIRYAQVDFDEKRLAGDDLACYAEALAHTVNFEKAAEVLPTLTNAAPERIALIKGTLALQKKDFKEAVNLFSSVSTGEAIPLDIRYRANLFTALAAQQLRDLKLAEEKLLACAELLPRQGTQQLTLFYLANGRNADAKPWLKKMIELLPDSPHPKLRLAEIYASEKDTESLKKLIEELPMRGRQDIEVKNYLEATIAFLGNDFEGTLRLLDMAPSCANRVQTYVMRFYSQVMTRKFSALPETADKLFAIAVRNGPAYKDMLEKLAVMQSELIRAQRVEEANAIAQVILKHQSANAPDNIVIDSLRIAVLDAVRRNRHEEIAAYSQQILRKNPRDEFGNLYLGQALLASGSPAEALNYFNRLPVSGTTEFEKARANLALGKRAEASKFFEAAWKLSPGDLPMFAAWSDLLVREKNYAKVEELIKQLPDTPAVKYLVISTRARIAGIEGQSDVQKKYAYEALELLKGMPSSPPNNYQRAYYLALTGQDQEAAKIYRELLAATPESLMILINLSQVEAAIGNHQDALNLAEKAARLYPQSPVAKDCLARRQAEQKKDGANAPAN